MAYLCRNFGTIFFSLNQFIYGQVLRGKAVRLGVSF